MDSADRGATVFEDGSFEPAEALVFILKERLPDKELSHYMCSRCGELVQVVLGTKATHLCQFTPLTSKAP